MMELQQIFRDVLDDESLVLVDETIPAQLPGWDSLAHINIMFAIEEQYDVKFSTREFSRIRTFGDLRDLVASKGGDA